MSEDERPYRNPIPAMIVLLLLVGGGWYFFHHYQISGLDKVSIRGKESEAEDSDFDYISDHGDSVDTAESGLTLNPFTLTRKLTDKAPDSEQPRQNLPRLRIASWALDGFVPERLADDTLRQNLVRVIRQFDLIALQQVPAASPELLPRMVAASNADDRQYDYVIGSPTGPSDRSTTLAFLFNKARLQIDRSQTYTVADPQNVMIFDPLVGWFRAVGPEPESAWTFSLVNIQIDLARAREEVKLLSQIMASVRFDGRGEDDVVLAGLFQADDAYLLPTIGGSEIQAAVRGKTTDVAGKHQVSNLLVDANVTSAFTSRGGVLDFLRVFNLSIEEAEALSTQLPVYGEFRPVEGEAF